ncbi:nucleoside recognition family protein [Aliamphritea hakodatensis]|uniref:nucleoside recognition family protein n=1 Tax=Aliamphritea hakodatensis TaxID=2895352 RepID=UPI0022FD9DCF|nr:nucleoside recognition family protein [Aliamphritea hakodatensis]
MEQIVPLILESGRTAIDMALYLLMPVMVVMLALMKLLEAKGVLAFMANRLSPLLRVFGIPGMGVFAIVKILFVSFSAPVATLAVMDKDGTARRSIAATLAAVLTLSQANVVFPLAAVGLDLGMMMLTSVIGGLVAASATYYWFARQPVWQDGNQEDQAVEAARQTPKSIMQIMSDGGQEGIKIVISSIPLLILAICLVNVLKLTGAIEGITWLLSPLLELLALPEAAVLPIVTKFIAGGTAMMGVTLDLLDQGLLTVTDLNRIAGFAINPFDVVGVAIIISAGARVRQVAKAAIMGATVGVLVRGALHLLIF